MGIQKRKGAYEIYVYQSAAKRKIYVGRRKLEREAKALFRDKTIEFKAGPTPASMTIAGYAAEWLEVHHGKGTRRPAASTYQVNELNLRPFLQAFGDRPLDGGIKRREALAWAKEHPHNAKSVSAMFNDAVDDEEAKGNPFANRRHEQSRERRHIAPISQDELDRLADIALRHWGQDGYGQVARAWVLFAAWVGCRPGEVFGTPLKSVDFHRGLVTIRRVKPPYNTDTVVLPREAKDAIRDAIPLLAREGPMFRTVTGRTFQKGALHYHWEPIRSAFRETVSEERWNALIDFDEGGKRKDLHLYVLRHRVASVMADRGATAREIAEQLGNSPEVCERTYVHAFREDVQERNRRLLDPPDVIDLSSRRRGA